MTTAAGYQLTALKTADREPMGALCGVCGLASGRDRAEDSQQAPAGFHTGKIPCKNFLQGCQELEQLTSQNLNPRRGDIIFTAPGIDFFKNQFWESRRAAVVENYISPEGGGKNSRGGGEKIP